jgi:DNA-binding response OmpR family regulator
MRRDVDIDILVIERTPKVGLPLSVRLRAAGIVVSVAGAVASGIARLNDDRVKAVVVHLDLPDIRGASAVRLLRRATDAPIVAILPTRDVDEAVRTFEAGADCCFPQPVSARVVGACIRSLWRTYSRGHPSGTDRLGSAPIAVGGLVIDSRTREALLDGRSLRLAPMEFDLLEYLAARAGTVVSKRELLEEVWHEPYDVSDKTVNVHLSWLRRKLGETGDRPRYLHTVRGVGVRLVAPEIEGVLESDQGEASGM